MRAKSFRQWLQDRWFEHLDELDAWHLPRDHDLKQYFNRYRWWLKREYQHYLKTKT